MEAGRDHGLNAKEAGRVLEQVQAIVALWREEAIRLNIPMADRNSTFSDQNNGRQNGGQI